MWTYRAALVRVIDGDTYELDIDLGFHVTMREHVRLLGIDCPEHGTPEGDAATVAATEWFRYARWGFQVTTLRGKDAEVKTFDRWVAAIVALDDKGQPTDADLATALRAAGHIKPVEHLGRRTTPPRM